MRTLEEVENQLKELAKDISYLRHQGITPIKDIQDQLIIDKSIEAKVIESDPRKDALAELGQMVVEAWCQTSLKNSRQLNVFNCLNSTKTQNILRQVQG